MQGRVIPKSQKVEANPMSISAEQINSMWSCHAMEYYLTMKKEVPDTRMNLEQVVLSERKPDTKGHVLFDSVCMECPEPASPQVQKAVLAARGSGGDCQEVRGAFWGGDNALELGSSGG